MAAVSKNRRLLLKLTVIFNRWLLLKKSVASVENQRSRRRSKSPEDHGSRRKHQSRSRSRERNRERSKGSGSPRDMRSKKGKKLGENKCCWTNLPLTNITNHVDQTKRRLSSPLKKDFIKLKRQKRTNPYLTSSTKKDVNLMICFSRAMMRSLFLMRLQGASFISYQRYRNLGKMETSLLAKNLRENFRFHLHFCLQPPSSSGKFLANSEDYYANKIEYLQYSSFTGTGGETASFGG
ncbi:Uncharacterized protein Fot_28229 [Forsythia ovata]|uniref:Uncharacterized protein n=1 Tax=Forsythia ovata TaxID=205694 RepID=A0ABD1TNE6_9LAMI